MATREEHLKNAAPVTENKSMVPAGEDKAPDVAPTVTQPDRAPKKPARKRGKK